MIKIQMRHFPCIPLRFASILICTSVFLTLSGCGGGDSAEGQNTFNGSGGGSTSGTASGATTVTGFFREYSSNNPIADAELDILIQSRSGDLVIKEKTNQNGEWIATFPSNISYPKQFIGTLRKDGYRTTDIIFGLDQNNKVVQHSFGIYTTFALEAGDVVVKNGHRIIHLGDANFDGTANSQLQVSNSGLQMSWSVSPVSTRLMAGYDSLCVYMTARGVETSHGNKNTIALGGLTISLPDSSPDGVFTLLKSCFPTNRLGGMAASSTLRVSSGNRGGSDYDDFEVVNIWARLEEPNNKTSQLPNLTFQRFTGSHGPVPTHFSETNVNTLRTNAEYVLNFTDGYFPLGTKQTIVNFGDGSPLKVIPSGDQPNGAHMFSHNWVNQGTYTLTLQYVDEAGRVLKESTFPLKSELP